MPENALTAPTPPSAYRPGYRQARATHPELADRYIAHTRIADPLADAAIAALAQLDQRDVHRLIHAGMERQDHILRQAPLPLREFFDAISVPPPWFDPRVVHPGRIAFHAYSDLFIPAFFVVTLQNAATLISKSFYMTGRVLTGYGARRIRQNTRHFVEIMLPGALERQGEGWKLSVRIRLVHAQVRRLLQDSRQWDDDAWGVPVSAAHLGLSAANFSATMIRQTERLGARLDPDARAGFMQAWRYASYLIGVPEALLFDGDEAATTDLSRVGSRCEPPPGPESAAIANALVQALPDIAGLSNPAARRAMVTHTYRVSRALLGHELADSLDFPRQQTAGVLTWLKWRRRAYHRVRRAFPGMAERWRGNSFVFLLDAAELSDSSYRLPDRMRAEQATPW